jgi:hypothetical protein
VCAVRSGCAEPDEARVRRSLESAVHRWQPAPTSLREVRHPRVPLDRAARTGAEVTDAGAARRHRARRSPIGPVRGTGPRSVRARRRDRTGRASPFRQRTPGIARRVPHVFATRQMEGDLTPSCPTRTPLGRAKFPANPALIIRQTKVRVPPGPCGSKPNPDDLSRSALTFVPNFSPTRTRCVNDGSNDVRPTGHLQIKGGLHGRVWLRAVRRSAGGRELSQMPPGKE